jgi:hypothetical protein
MRPLAAADRRQRLSILHQTGTADRRWVGDGGPGEPDSTGSMWLRMLGLEDVWRVANSADFQAQISSIIAAILETNARCARIDHASQPVRAALGIH